jgi:hypothetical protein
VCDSGLSHANEGPGLKLSAPHRGLARHIIGNHSPIESLETSHETREKSVLHRPHRLNQRMIKIKTREISFPGDLRAMR